MASRRLKASFKAHHKSDILNRKNHPLTWSAEGPGKINQRLHEAVLSAPPFAVGDSLFTLVYAHIGQGPYRQGSCFGWHQHSGYQLEVVLAGKFIFRTKTSRILLSSGDALLISPKTEHRWETKTGGVMLGGDLHRSMLARKLQHKESVGVGSVFHVRHGLLRSFVQSLGEAMNVRGFSALDAISIKGALAGVVATALSNSFPCSDAALSDRGAAHASAHVVEIVERTCKFLVDNLRRRVSAAELNKISGLTSRHLNRLFRKHVGTSVHQFIIDARLIRAEEMLRSQSDPLVKEVAFACGFSSTSHLTTLMKKRRGALPSQLAGN